MTSESTLEQAGLSISYSEPLLLGGQPIDVMVESVSAYQHAIAARGGFLSASITLAGNLQTVEDWYANGLGRHIVTYDEAQDIVWEGFVNTVQVRIGALTAIIGPLMGICNRASLVYSSVDTSTTPPTLGGRTKSAVSNDAASQAAWGILEKVISASGVTASQITTIILTYLVNNAAPSTTEYLGFGQEAVPEVVLGCLGYRSWLDVYVYQQLTSGTITATQKIKDILTASPNALFSSDQTRIATNTLSLAKYENDDATAQALINAVVIGGDAAGNNYDFGIYEGRQAVYAARPNTFGYIHRLSDNAQRIENMNGASVAPYAVRPGAWVLISDFLVGYVPAGVDIIDDPRALYIESLSYKAPFDVTLNGGRVSTLAQKVAKLGILGIGGPSPNDPGGGGGGVQ